MSQKSQNMHINMLEKTLKYVAKMEKYVEKFIDFNG